MSFLVAYLRGGQGFHDGYSRIAALYWERKGAPPGPCGNNSEGRFKGGIGSRHQLQEISNKTDLKFKVKWWLDRSNIEFIRQGQ